MKPEANPGALSRRERFGRLGEFCAALAAALQQSGLGPDQLFVKFREQVSAECEQCHTKIAGEELFVLRQPPEGQDLSVGLRRLRLGFCANPECQAFHCRVTFRPGEGEDWTACLRRVDRALQDLEDVRAGRGKRWKRELIRPALMALGVVVALLLLRQFYFGGRIPWVREPEKWRVTPDPSGQVHQ